MREDGERGVGGVNVRLFIAIQFDSPQKISTELWANEHLDCNAIIDDLGSYIVVYAFTRDPKYNYALTKYKKEKNYTKQFILRGISSDGLNSLL